MKSNMKVELELTIMIFHKSVCQGKKIKFCFHVPAIVHLTKCTFIWVLHKGIQ